MERQTKFTTFFLVAIIVGTVITGLLRNPRVAGPLEYDSGRLMLMGTFARIKVVAHSRDQAEAAVSRARSALQDVNTALSTYRDDSEISRVNRLAGAGPVAVGDQTYRVLKRALHFSELTDGAFDVTVAPLVALWNRCAEAGRMPSESELAEVMPRVGYRKLILDDASQTVAFGAPGMALTVDAIAKGYAVDRAAEALRGPGVTAGLVDIGGEIVVFGRRWHIGIQDPFAPDTDDPFSEHPRWAIAVADRGVATSGNYRRYVTIDGRRYSHIVHPRTGLPAEKLPSVTVIAPTAMDADALATSVSVMGAGSGATLIESLAGVEAFCVAGSSESPEVIRTSGFAEFELGGDQRGQ